MNPLISAGDWENFYESHAGAHILQAPQWGRLKANFGWEPVPLQKNDCGAQVLFRKLPLGLSVAYIPKGPVGENWPDLWPELDALCRQKRAVFLKVEPDLWDTGNATDEGLFLGFIKTDATVQPRRTILIDLEGGEEAWLDRMKQKTRYNIKLAERKDVKIESSADVDEFYRLVQVTGGRDGFGVHALSYYQKAYELFSEGEQCALLIARFEQTPLAGLMVFRHGRRAWYLYGASSDEERNRMPAYLIQHAAMKWAYERGCREYDLWGIPDYAPDYLEANFMSRADGLWGVYRFKRGFGGESFRSAGAWEKIFNPIFYKFYQWIMKRRGFQGG